MCVRLNVWVVPQFEILQSKNRPLGGRDVRPPFRNGGAGGLHIIEAAYGVGRSRVANPTGGINGQAKLGFGFCLRFGPGLMQVAQHECGLPISHFRRKGLALGIAERRSTNPDLVRLGQAAQAELHLRRDLDAAQSTFYEPHMNLIVWMSAEIKILHHLLNSARRCVIAHKPHIEVESRHHP
jgi:hypothetical protein